MNTNTRNTLRETGRWLRITVLTLTTIGPIINVVAARIRQRAQVLSKATEQPELVEQGSQTTQALAERSSEIASMLAERSSKAAQTLAERSSKASQELARRSEELAQEVKRRSRQVTQQLAERDGTFWTFLGFSIGLIVASVAAYLLIRRRFQKSIDEHLQALSNEYVNIPSRPMTPTTTRAAPPAGQPPASVQPQPALTPTESAVAVAEPAPTPAESTVAGTKPAPVQTEHPAYATLIGIVSTKRYYPVETPFDQLADSQEGPLEVVYFTSQDEAKAQGFVAAE
jgi:uncharacterized membrane-anchored protein YhcB (DUF1043 family)